MIIIYLNTITDVNYMQYVIITVIFIFMTITIIMIIIVPPTPSVEFVYHSISNSIFFFSVR